MSVSDLNYYKHVEFVVSQLLEYPHIQIKDTMQPIYFKDIPNRTVVFDLDDTIFNTKTENPITSMCNLVIKAQTMGYHIIILTARPPQDRHVVDSIIKSMNSKRKWSPPMKFDNIFTAPFWITDTNITPPMWKLFKSIYRNNLSNMDIKSVRKINAKNPNDLKKLYNNTISKSVGPMNKRLNIILTIGDQPQDIMNTKFYGLLLRRSDRSYKDEGLYYNNRKIAEL